MYFKKIDLKLKDFNYIELKGNLLFSFGKIDTNISYYEIRNTEILNTLYNIEICKIKPTHCYLAEVTGIGLLRPHRDHGTLSCLNYYLESNDSKTVFYKTKENAKPFRYDGAKTDNIYDIQDLDPQDNFIAQDKESFLLDVSEIHSVSCLKQGTRRFISWQWSNTSFNDILKNLNYPIVD